MDVSIISQLVGSLGFPVVCCGYMMVVINRTMKENTDVTNKLAVLIERLLQREGGNNE